MLGLAAVAFAFYLPALSGRFVFTDDYSYFYHPQNPTWYVEALNQCGRPLTGQYLRLCHRIIAKTGSPDLAHLPGLLGVMLLGLASFGWLRLCGVRTLPAFQFCLVLLTLPSALLCVTYLNCGSYGWAALASALALVTFAPALRRPGLALGWKLLLGSAAWALLVAGMFLYQPSALWYWTLTAAALLCGPTPTWAAFRARAAPLFALGLAAMAGYFIAYKIYFWAEGLTPLARGELSGDVGGKLAWFWAEPLHNALSLWQLPPTHWRFPRNVLILILAGGAAELLGLFRRRRGGDAPAAEEEGRGRRAGLVLVRWATGFALLPLSYAFNLAVSESWPAYRTLLPLAATTAVLAFAALQRMAELLPRRLCAPALTGALALAATACVAAGGANMMRLLILPRIAEFEYVKTRLLDYDPARHRSIHVVRPVSYEGAAPATIYDEFGVPCSCAVWVPDGLVRKALADLHQRGPVPPVTQSGPDEDDDPPEGALVIDIRELYRINPYRLGGPGRR
jgi:hypothetical protein